MKILNLITFQYMKLNKKITLSSILAVILSSILIFSFGMIFSTTRDNMIKYELYNNGDYHLKFYDIKYSDVNKITSEAIGKYYIEEKKYNYETDEFSLNLVMVNDEFLKRFEIIDGKLPRSENEIIISSLFKKIKDVKIDDVYTLDKEYKIVGTYKEYPYFCHDYYKSDNRLCGSFYGVKNNFNDDDVLNISVKFDEVDKEILSSRDSIANSLGLKKNIFGEYLGLSLNSGLLDLYGVSEKYGLLAIMTVMLMLVLTVVSTVCFFVIYNSFAISLNEKKKYFGILSSIGATPMQIFKSVFFEAAIISIIGITIGLIISIATVFSSINIINYILDDLLTIKLAISMYPLFIIIPLLFITATIFLSTLSPAKRAQEIMPIEAIKGLNDIKIKGKKIKSKKLFLKLFGIEGEIARKNIKRNKRKYRITVISLVISIIMVLVFSFIINLGIFVAKKITEPPNAYQVSIKIYNDNKNEFIEELKKNKNVTKLTISKSSIYIIKEKLNVKQEFSKYFQDDVNVITIARLEEEDYQDYLRKLKIKNRTPILINARYFLLENENVFYKNVYSIKENIKFTICKSGFEANDGLVIGKCDYNLGNVHVTNILPFGIDKENLTSPYVIISDKMFNDILASYSPIDRETTYIAANTKDYILAEKQISEMLSKHQLSSYEYINFPFELHKVSRYTNAIKMSLYTFILFIILICSLNVYNTITTGIHTRKKEFIMLRSIGMNEKGFNKIIKYESLMFSLKSLIFGIPISIGVYNLVLRTFLLDEGAKKMFKDIPFPTIYILLTIIGVYLITYISMYRSSIKIKNGKIAENLKK